MRPWAPAIRSPGQPSAGLANLRCAPGDETILEDAPVTYLMSLEHQFTEVLGFMRALQLTDPAEDWVWDSTEACWRTRAAPGGSPRGSMHAPCSAGAGRNTWPRPSGSDGRVRRHALMSRLRKATLDGKLWTCRARNPEGRRSLVKSLISWPLRVTRIRGPVASIR